MFPVTITVHDVSQLNSVIKALGIPLGIEQSASVKVDKPTAPPTPEPAPVEAVQEKAAEVAPSTEPVAEVSYQDAATAITKLSRTKGRDAAVAVLSEFKAANLKEVKPEHFGAVVAAVEKALGE